LTQRWLPEDAYLETHAGDLLFEPPRNLGLNPLDPDQALGADADEFLSGLLLNLVDSLNAHIASRDRTLVEQASLLIVWRPLLKGILSKVSKRRSSIATPSVSIDCCQLMAPLVSSTLPTPTWRISDSMHFSKL